MRTVVFVAPFLRENTLRFVRAFADLPDTRLGLVSQDPSDRLPEDLRPRVATHWRIGDCTSGEEIARACRAMSRSGLGPVDRLLGHLEQLQIPVAEARDSLGLEGMSAEVARNFRDKARMKDVLRRAGIPVARSRLLTSERDLWAFVREVGLPVVLKPPAGLGAAATFRISDEAELREALVQIRPTPESPFQAEEFVLGQENTCETVMIHGEPVWRSGTRYLPGPLEVIENPWMQYCVLLPREADDPDFISFHPIDRAALTALGMRTGLSHLEWFRRKDGAAVVSEVGARPPGAMILPLMSQAHEVDMIAKWAELMVFDRFEPPVRKWAAGVAFFRGQGKGRVKAVHGLDRAQAEVGHLVVDRKLPEAGQPKAAGASGYEGEGWALVRAATTQEVAHALKRLITLVRVEYA